MNRVLHGLRGLSVLLALGLAACNLNANPPVTLTPTLFVQAPTATPTATPTSTPTTTPLPPTATSRPPVTPVYRVNRPLPGPTCSLSPVVDAANVRSGPGTAFPVLGVLPAGHWAAATRQDLNGWYQISSPGTPVEAGWISGTVVGLQQPCACGPNNCAAVTTPIPPSVTPITPPPDWCALTVVSTALLPVYLQPSISATVWGQIGLDTVSQVVGRTADGWYAINPAAAGAVNVGIYRLRWVRSDSPINLTGVKCGMLPVIDLSTPITTMQCRVEPVNISSVPIYGQTSYDAGTVGSLAAGNSLVVVGQTPPNHNGSPGGWYAIDGGSPNSVGRYRLQWIPVDNNVQLDADCPGLATVTLDP